MNAIYQIDQDLKVPIYQQIVDCVRAGVNKGILSGGDQLPTVQELSRELNIARGTITRAYDALEREGLIEKVQGRGTFVRKQEPSGSRKAQAMHAIDKMLDDLGQMGFSAGEINIFLNLKLRQRAEQEALVKLAVVECNPENLSSMVSQLQTIPYVQVYAYRMDALERYPYKLEEDADLILTTAAHAQMLTDILPVKKRVTSIALRLESDCLVQILRLQDWTGVGILCHSRRFGQLLEDTCAAYAPAGGVDAPVQLDADMDWEGYLQKKHTLLVPMDWRKYCTDALWERLCRFRGAVISCGYALDEGSFLYVQEKVKRLMEAKSI